MLRFNQLGRLGLHARYLQLLASRAASTSAARVQPPPIADKAILSAEQLQAKYKDILKSAQVSTIYDVIERVELGGDSISGKIASSAHKLLVDTKTDVSALSDRQLSQIICVFGVKADSVPKEIRNKFLSEGLTGFQNKNVSLGPQARTAIFTAKVDNGELPSVVEELQAWETAGLTPNEEILQQFAKVYALEGNTTGVIDIMNYMKNSEINVDENIIGPLVYSMASNGQSAQAEVVAKKFTGILSEVALKVAIAEGLIKSGENEKAINILATLAGSKITNFESNRYLLRVLCTLIETGTNNALEKLSNILNLSEDKLTLNEKSYNGYVLSRVRNAIAEKNLSSALYIYKIVHPNFKNKVIEEKAVTKYVEYIKKERRDISELKAIWQQIEEITSAKPKIFLLESSIGTPNWKNIFNNLKPDLQEILSEKPELKMSLSKELSRELTKADLPTNQRIETIADIATVFFTKTEAPDPADAYKIIYALSGHDVEYIIGALKLIKDERIKRETTTAAIQQALKDSEDPLRFEKIEKLINSDVSTGINISRIDRGIKKLAMSKTNGDKYLGLVAKMIALAFPESNSRFVDTFGTKYIQGLICERDIPVDRLRVIVDHLEMIPKVRLPREDVQEVKNKLTEQKMTDRLEIADRLKAQGVTFARWMASTPASLEEEMVLMEGNSNIKRNAIFKIQEVILLKLLQEEKVNFAATERILRKIGEADDTPNRLKKVAATLWEKGFSHALRESKDDVAHIFWEIKTTFSAEAALSYISLHFVKGNIEKSDEVCATLISSAQTITGGALEAAGRIVSTYDASKVEGLSSYLKDKLHLKTYQSRRIVNQIRNKQLKSLIASGDLEAALKLAIEETSATGLAFGQHDLFKASFEKKNPALTENVFKMVVNAHDKSIAILDLAFAMLESGITQHAANLLKTNELKISSKKLEYFVNRAVDMQRTDMLKTLFVSLYTNKAAGITDLNKLLMQLTKIYYKSNNYEELDLLEAQVKEMLFPLEPAVKKVFDMQRQKKGAIENDVQIGLN